MQVIRQYARVRRELRVVFVFVCVGWGIQSRPADAQLLTYQNDRKYRVPVVVYQGLRCAYVQAAIVSKRSQLLCMCTSQPIRVLGQLLALGAFILTTNRFEIQGRTRAPMPPLPLLLAAVAAKAKYPKGDEANFLFRAQRLLKPFPQPA